MASSACCTIPPAKSDYEPTGKYETIGELKSYVVGDAASERVLIGKFHLVPVLA